MTKWILLPEKTLFSHEAKVGWKAIGGDAEYIKISFENDSSTTSAVFNAIVEDDRGIGNNMGSDIYLHPIIKRVIEDRRAGSSLEVNRVGKEQIKRCDEISITVRNGDFETVKQILQATNYIIHSSFPGIIPDAKTKDDYGEFVFVPEDVKPEHHTLRITENTTVNETEQVHEEAHSSGSSEWEVEDFLVDKEPDRSLKEDTVGLQSLEDIVTAFLRINHPDYGKTIKKAYDPDVGGGILLYGPPGCGKTLGTEGLAYEIAHRCLHCNRLGCQKHVTLSDEYENVKYVKLDGAEIADRYVGEAPKKLKQAIDYVFDLENDDNFVVFFIDEADSIIANRGSSDQEQVSRLTNTFLDKIERNTLNHRSVLLVAGTNYPYEIDTAALDRFMIEELFEPPSEPEEYAKLWRINTQNDNLDFMELGEASQGYVPREIVQLIEKTVWDRITAPDLNISNPQPLTTDDYLEALEQNPPETLNRYVNDVLGDAHQLSGWNDLRTFCQERAGNSQSDNSLN